MSLRIESNFVLGGTSASRRGTLEKLNEPIFGLKQGDKVSQKNKAAINRYNAIHEGSLVRHEEEQKDTYLFGLFKISSHVEHACYEYTANGKETIYQIKKKFGIKDGALAKFNPSYKESDSTDICIPTAGTKLRFYEYDVE